MCSPSEKERSTTEPRTACLRFSPQSRQVTQAGAARRARFHRLIRWMSYSLITLRERLTTLRVHQLNRRPQNFSPAPPTPAPRSPNLVNDLRRGRGKPTTARRQRNGFGVPRTRFLRRIAGRLCRDPRRPRYGVSRRARVPSRERPRPGKAWTAPTVPGLARAHRHSARTTRRLQTNRRDRRPDRRDDREPQ